MSKIKTKEEPEAAYIGMSESAYMETLKTIQLVFGQGIKDLVIGLEHIATTWLEFEREQRQKSYEQTSKGVEISSVPVYERLMANDVLIISKNKEDGSLIVVENKDGKLEVRKVKSP